MIKAIIFDFDGVIVESVNVKTDAFAKLFEEEGKEVVGRVVRYHLDNTGVSRYDKFRYIYRDILKRPLGEDKFKELCGRFEKLVLDEVIKVPYVKGALEFLKDGARKYAFYITSATPQEELKIIITRRGLSKFFKAVYGAPKNKADAVREIIKEAGLGLQEVVYIGDAASDYNAARDNGISFIARINDNKEIFKGIACEKIADLTELRDAIDRLGPR